MWKQKLKICGINLADFGGMFHQILKGLFFNY